MNIKTSMEVVLNTNALLFFVNTQSKRSSCGFLIHTTVKASVVQSATRQKGRNMETLDFIMAFESGELSKDELVEGFQKLIDNGIVWNLQGMYGRTAQNLIDAGLCHKKE